MRIIKEHNMQAPLKKLLLCERNIKGQKSHLRTKQREREQGGPKKGGRKERQSGEVKRRQ
jgi:hypothetical protein